MTTINKTLRFFYSLICYALGVTSLVYFILFVSDIGISQIGLTRTVNSIDANVSMGYGLFINLLLLCLFGIQHSVMARASFKLKLNRMIHPSMERSTYVLATALVIGVMCYLWIPIGSTVWRVESEVAILIIQLVAGASWSFLLIATFMLNHFELFGLSQTFNPLVGKDAPKDHFRTPGFYKIVRHPIQTGVLIGVWAVPVSTMSHIMFASGMTTYIFVGLYFEERDLVSRFGETYTNYIKRVKRVIPFIA